MNIRNIGVMKKLRFGGLMIGLVFLSHTLSAQEAETPVPADVAELKAEIEMRFSQFSDELNQMLVVGQMTLSVDGAVGVSPSVGYGGTFEILKPIIQCLRR